MRHRSKILGALFALLAGASVAFADVSGPPAGSYIQNRKTRQVGSTLYVDSGTITNLNAQTIKMSGAAEGLCLATGAGGVFTLVPCGSAGGVIGSTATFQSSTVTPVTIISSGTVNALKIISHGVPSGGVQSSAGGALNIEMRNVGEGIVIHSSTTDLQQGSTFLSIRNNSPFYNDPLIWVEDVGAASNPLFRGDSFAPDFEIVNESTDTAHGMGKWEPFAVAFQGTALSINSRSFDNSTFERVAEFRMRQKGSGLALYPTVNAENGNPSATSAAQLVWISTSSNREFGLKGPQTPDSSFYFTLPKKPNNLGNVLYQQTNGPDRILAFTDDGITGQCLKFNTGAAPTWGTCGSGAGSTYSIQYRDETGALAGSGFFLDINQQALLIGTTVGAPGTMAVLESSANGSSYVAWKASESLSGSTTWIMPDADGSPGDVLTTVGAVGNRHVTKWAPAVGGVPTGGTGAVQYRSGGAFVGSDKVFIDTTNGSLALQTTSQLRLFQLDNNHYTGWVAQSTGMAGSVVYQMPLAGGTSGQSLVTYGGPNHITAWVTRVALDPPAVQTGSIWITSATVAGYLTVVDGPLNDPLIFMNDRTGGLNSPTIHFQDLGVYLGSFGTVNSNPQRFQWLGKGTTSGPGDTLMTLGLSTGTLNVKYGVEAASFTTTGVDSGQLYLYEGSTATITATPGATVIWSSGTALLFNPNATSTNTVVGSSAAVVNGNAACWSSQGSLIDCGAGAGGGGSDNLGNHIATRGIVAGYGILASSITASSSTVLGGATFYADAPIRMGGHLGSTNALLINAGNKTGTGGQNILISAPLFPMAANYTSANSNTCIGSAGCQGLVTDSHMTGLGRDVFKLSSGASAGTCTGSGCGFSQTSGASNTGSGRLSIFSNETGSNITASGANSCNNAGFVSSRTLSGAICLGVDTWVDESNVAAIGSDHNSGGGFLTDVYWNSKSKTTAAAGRSITFHSQASSGTNAAGGNYIMAGGQGTGTGIGGAITFKVSSAGVSGIQMNPLITVGSFTANGLQTDVGVNASTITARDMLAIHGGVFHQRMNTISASYTAVSTDSVILANCATACTITLPDATAASGQAIAITKIHSSTQTVTLRSAGSDLIMNSSTTVILNAQGQTIRMISDSDANWISEGNDATPDIIGERILPVGSGNVSTSSTTWLQSVFVPSHVALLGIRVQVQVQSGTMELGIMDRTGVILGRTGTVNVPSGTATTALTSPVNLAPGYYYFALTASNTTAQFGRVSQGNIVGAITFSGTSAALANQNPASGVTNNSRFAIAGIVSGGITQ